MADAQIRVTRLDFDDNENPTQITVTMPVKLAALLAKHCGALYPASVIPAGSYEATSELYDCLTGRVFNTFWEDGVNGYFAEADS